MNPADTSAGSRLGDIVGNANVVSDPAQLADYVIGGKTPGAAVRPGSAAEVAEIVKFAAAEKLAIVACGARTKLGHGLRARSLGFGAGYDAHGSRDCLRSG